MSAMRETMRSQPAALERILADSAPVEAAAERVRGRRIILVGTGTSWHAANQGAWLLRAAGVEAWAVQAADAAEGGPFPTPDEALVLLTHRGTKRYTTQVAQRAHDTGVPTILVSRMGNPDADLDTVPPETSSAFTASHLGALLRLAQLATHLGAGPSTDYSGLAAVPEEVADELAEPATGVVPPRRLLEFAGVGANAWTASEGALKTRETSYLATEGGWCEQLIHGPSVALGPDDTLVVLDGGGPAAGRLDDLAEVVSAHGSTVHRFARPELGALLSIFPLTVVVQKIAAEMAEARGTDPDTFGRDLPGRAEAWSRLTL